MTKRQINKAVIIYIAVFTAITLVWSIIFYAVVLPHNFTKTQATVISLRSESPSTYRGGRQVNKFPTYSYTDNEGKDRVYESTDGFNSINGIFFKKTIGDKVVAYYGNDDKGELWITDTGDWYIFLLGPLVLAILPFGAIFGVVLYLLHKKNHS